MTRTRTACVLFHRWAGLAMAGFLVIAGLTGALLAWQKELDATISPHLFRVAPPAPHAQPLDLLTLRELASQQTGETLRYFSLKPPQPGHSVVFRLDNKKGREDILVDPYTGRILGRRVWGDLSEGVVNLIPFIYRLHHSLALGVFGDYLFGIVALLWTLDCFVGAYLTFPATRRHFWQRWGKSWQLRMNGGAHKRNFDLHRAGGLWVWVMLLVLAWSSVAFNLSEVYDPVMKTLFAHQPRPAQLALRKSNPQPKLDWWQARETARRLMAEQAEKRGFKVFSEDWFVHDPAHNLYFYDVRSSLDVADRRHKGQTRLFFDADSGQLLHMNFPTGAAAGDTIRTWLTSLHRAEPWGVPYKIFMAGMGCLVAMLSFTGVVIWLRKRAAKLHSAAKRYRTRATSERHAV